MAQVFPLANGSFVEVRVMGVLHGQQCIMTFRYETVLDGGATTTDFAEVFDYFDGELWDKLRLVISNEFLEVRFQIQLIDPVRYIYAEFTPADTAGAVTSGCLTSGVAYDFRKRTLQAGKQFRGRLYVPGVPIANENNSAVATAILEGAAVADIGVAMCAPIALAGGSEFVPSLIVPTEEGWTNRGQITSISLDPVLRYQRRRELRVGS